jgi:hypothetical protein
MARRAKELAAKVRAENGLTNAISMVEADIFSRFNRS